MRKKNPQEGKKKTKKHWNQSCIILPKMPNFQLKNYVTCKKAENMTHTQSGKKAVNENKL